MGTNGRKAAPWGPTARAVPVEDRARASAGVPRTRVLGGPGKPRRGPRRPRASYRAPVGYRTTIRLPRKGPGWPITGRELTRRDLAGTAPLDAPGRQPAPAAGHGVLVRHPVPEKGVRGPRSPGRAWSGGTHRTAAAAKDPQWGLSATNSTPPSGSIWTTQSLGRTQQGTTGIGKMSKQSQVPTKTTPEGAETRQVGYRRMRFSTDRSATSSEHSIAGRGGEENTGWERKRHSRASPTYRMVPSGKEERSLEET